MLKGTVNSHITTNTIINNSQEDGNLEEVSGECYSYPEGTEFIVLAKIKTDEEYYSVLDPKNNETFTFLADYIDLEGNESDLLLLNSENISNLLQEIDEIFVMIVKEELEEDKIEYWVEVFHYEDNEIGEAIPKLCAYEFKTEEAADKYISEELEGKYSIYEVHLKDLT